MDIHVFDKKFNRLGLIDVYESLIWRRNHYKSGNFELHGYLPQSDVDALALIHLLRKDNILWKEDSPDEAAYINDIVLDDQEQEKIIVSGYFIDNIISERIVWGLQTANGPIESVMKHYVNKNAVSPDNPKRIIPGLVLSANRGITIQASTANSYGNLSELMEELAITHDVGWRVLFDLENKDFLFDVYEGKDLTVNQDINPQAIFSLEYENVTNQTFTDSENGHKNMALVAGQGEGADRKIALINNDKLGFNRKELYVDARDLSQEKEDGTSISDEEYETMLIGRGETQLAELKPIKTFESGISVLSNLIYKQDFDLGDKVTVQNNRWGIILNTRITSVEEVYEGNKFEVLINFGSNIPTLIDRIKQKMR